MLRLATCDYACCVPECAVKCQSAFFCVRETDSIDSACFAWCNRVVVYMWCACAARHGPRHIREYIYDILSQEKAVCRDKLTRMNAFGWQSMTKFKNMLVVGVRCCEHDRRKRMTLMEARNHLSEMLK